MGSPPYDSALPGEAEGVTSMLVKAWQTFLVAIVLNDVGFYWTHRLLHHKSLYSRFHKQHHTYVGPVSFSAEHAHTLEILLSNHLPTMAGVLIMGAHPAVVLCWIAVRLQKTYEAHSGYCFYGSMMHTIGLANPEAAAWHDYHHTGNQGNYGALYLDWAFGTMDKWIELGGTEQYIRKTQGANASYLQLQRNK